MAHGKSRFATEALSDSGTVNADADNGSYRKPAPRSFFHRQFPGKQLGFGTAVGKAKYPY